MDMKPTFHTLRQLLIAIITTLLLLQSMGKASAARLIYDLNADWSNTQNPNGVWSYNNNTSPISVFQTFWWGEAGWGYLWIGDGCIIKGSQPTGTDPWGNPAGPSHDWLPGDVMMHALSIPYGGDTTFLNVTWTSPADGTIDISGRAWDGEISPDRDVAWSLIVGGKVVAERSSIRGLYRNNRQARFESNRVGRNRLTDIRVRQGEVVEFRVITDTYYGHFVGVEERITLKTNRRLRFPITIDTHWR